MEEPQEHPDIPTALMEWLQQQVPARCPDLTETDREIWAYAGQRALVELLQSLHDGRQDTSPIADDPLGQSFYDDVLQHP